MWSTRAEVVYMRLFSVIKLQQLMPMTVLCGTSHRPSVPNLVILATVTEVLCKKASCIPTLPLRSTKSNMDLKHQLHSVSWVSKS